MTPPARGMAPEFRREKMTDWLHPVQLSRTAVKAVVAGVFGAYADKREVQAALHPLQQSPAPYDADYSDYGSDDFWFDFVADLGDGFNSTYAIAWLLAQPSVTLPGPDETPLPRGRFLVMGGDQVYPTPGQDAYRHRLRGPYESALPDFPEGGRPDDPDLYAIPGNHDWYDGLTSFLRVFCQGRRIGRWATRQRRSYFALRLPHNWWLWGVDIQLGADIDQPQLDYFRRVGESMTQASPKYEEPRLILCTGVPTWVACGSEASPGMGTRYPEPHLFDSEAFFERTRIRECGIRLAATISGDAHHYMRYAGVSRSELKPKEPNAEGKEPAPEPHHRIQRITSGGGGAYLYPTHHMPMQLDLTEDDQIVRYRREAMYPSEEESHTWARKCFKLPFHNRMFSFFLGVIYLFFAWTLQSTSKGHTIDCGLPRYNATLMRCLQGRGATEVGSVIDSYWQILRHSPSNVAFALLVVLGLYQFRASEKRVAFPWLGAVHGVMHLLLCFGMIWAISTINLRHMQEDSAVQVVVFTLEMVIGGGFLGGMLFAFYLWFSSKFHAGHINELFSSQAIPDCKNFLRLRISRAGTLAMHAIGVPKVPQDDEWVDPAQRAEGDPFIVPKAGTIPVLRVDGPVNWL